MSTPDQDPAPRWGLVGHRHLRRDGGEAGLEMDKPKKKTLKRFRTVPAAICWEGDIGAGRRLAIRPYRPATRALHNPDHVYRVARAYVLELQGHACRVVDERRRIGLDVGPGDSVSVIGKITRKALRNLDLLISTRGMAGMLGVRRASSQLNALAEKGLGTHVPRPERNIFNALLRNTNRALQRIIGI